MPELGTLSSPQIAEKQGVFFPVHVQDGWLDSSLADDLLAYAITNEARFTPAPVLYSGQEKVNPDLYDALELQDLGIYAEFLYARIRSDLPGLQRQLGVGDFEALTGKPVLTAYGDGAHFRPHIDTHILANRFAIKHAGTRIMTLIVYLHEQPRAFKGGELVLHQVGGTDVRAIPPFHNRLVAFPAFAPHSVARVSCPGAAFAERRFAVNFPIFR